MHRVPTVYAVYIDCLLSKYKTPALSRNHLTVWVQNFRDFTRQIWRRKNPHLCK